MESKPVSGPELAEQPGVVAAQRAQVQLLRPAAARVPAAEFEHEVGAELRGLGGPGASAGPRRVKDRRGLGVGAGLGQRGLQAVVGQPAADRVEVVVALLQRAKEVVERTDAASAPRPPASRPRG